MIFDRMTLQRIDGHFNKLRKLMFIQLELPITKHALSSTLTEKKYISESLQLAMFFIKMLKWLFYL